MNSAPPAPPRRGNIASALAAVGVRVSRVPATHTRRKVSAPHGPTG